MANFTKINSFVENLAEKQIDLSGNGLTVVLTNTEHQAAWDELADLTQVSYTYCSARVFTVSSSAQSGGTYKLVVDDLTLEADGGTVGAFRYVYLYDDNSTNDKLIGYWDYGSSITLQDGENILLDASAVNGILTLA